MIKLSTDAETCCACGLLIPGKPYAAWDVSRQKAIVDMVCRALIHAAGDEGYNGFYPHRFKTSEVHATIVAMRADGKSWQKIATQLRMHPITVKGIGINTLGLAVNLPGRSNHGGGWTRRKALLAEPTEAPEREPTDDRRIPLPPGSYATWGAISVQPWPGVMAL